MKKRVWSICKWVSIILAQILGAVMWIQISYSWGYDQCEIDNNIAYYGWPPYVNLLSGVPWLLGAVLFSFLAYYCSRRGRK